MSAKLADFVVAGHICVDISPTFKTPAGLPIEKIFEPGSLRIMGPAVISTGGAVSNTGLSLRRLGQKVLLMGKCADDAFGTVLMQKLRSEAPGAEKGMTVVKGDSTSYSVVIAPPGIDRLFLHCPGANDTFTAADINLDLVKSARIFHFGYPPLMRKIFAQDGKELKKIFRAVSALGVTTSLDLAFPDPNSETGKADWNKILRNVLPHVDIFVPSAEELLFMLNRPRFDELRAQAGAGEMLEHFRASDIAGLGEKCMAYGAGIALIKCGKLGVYIRTASAARLGKTGRARPQPLKEWANRELWQPSYTAKKVVSATGSGDNAIAGFLSAYLHGQSIDWAIRYCCMAGYQNVQVLDSVSGIQSWEATTRMLRRRNPVNPIHIDMSGWNFNAKAQQYLGPSDQRSA